MGTAVIDRKQLKVIIRLRKNAFDSSFKITIRVVYGRPDRD